MAPITFDRRKRTKVILFFDYFFPKFRRHWKFIFFPIRFNRRKTKNFVINIYSCTFFYFIIIVRFFFQHLLRFLGTLRTETSKNLILKEKKITFDSKVCRIFNYNFIKRKTMTFWFSGKLIRFAMLKFPLGYLQEEKKS